MDRKKLIQAIVVIGLIIWLITIAVTGCARPVGIQSVNITMLGYDPKDLTIKPGTKVIWTNNDDTAHTVTADLGGFSSKILNPGDTYELTFPNKAEYKYHCDIHPYMKAKLTVK